MSVVVALLSGTSMIARAAAASTRDMHVVGVAVEELQRVGRRSPPAVAHNVDANWLHASSAVGGAASTPVVAGAIILAATLPQAASPNAA